MIRVAWFVDQFTTGGTELNAIRVAERLDRTQFDLSVLCFSEHGPLRERYRELEIPVRRIPIKAFYAPSSIKHGFDVVRILREDRPDVLHTHDLYSNIFAVPLARMAGVPRVFASRRWWKSPDRLSLRAANRFSSGFAHRILCNSRAVAHMIVEDERVPRSRVEVVWNFLEPEAFEPPSEEWLATKRAEYGLTPSTPVVGAVARLHPDKDLATLIRAFGIALLRVPQAKLVLVGGGPMKDELTALIQELGLADHVVLAGEQPSRPSLHHLFTVSALSSWTEGFPNTLLEAMAARRAIVATRVVGNVDAVDEGVSGILVPARDPAAFAAALGRLLGNPELRSAMGDAGFTRARTVFTAEASLAALTALYRGENRKLSRPEGTPEVQSLGGER